MEPTSEKPSIREERQPENFHNKWKRRDLFFSTALAYLFGAMGFSFVWVTFGLTNNWYSVIPFILAIVYIPPVLFRNRLFSESIRKTGAQDLYLRLRAWKRTSAILLFLFFYMLAVFSYRFVSGSYVDVVFSLSFAAVSFYVPILMLLNNVMSEKGEIRVFFGLLLSNMDNFNKRQEWLVKISRLLEKKLRFGRICVPRDILVYHFNLKFGEAPKNSALRLFYENALRKIENWIIGGEDYEFYDSLTMIVPRDELKPLERDARFKILTPYMPRIVELGLFLLVATILYFLNSDLASSFIGFFK